MDNLTHTLAGLALARTRLGTAPRAARVSTMALAVTANAPDIDVFPSFAPRLAGSLGHQFEYLEAHRGITHAVFGIVVQWVAWWVFFEWIERRGARRRAAAGETFEPHRSRLLGAAVLIGLASHPLLDWTNVYGIRPWLPFDRTWRYGDLLFIADPWLWLLLAVPALLAGPRTRVGNWSLALCAIVATVVIFRAGPNHVSATARVLWPILLLAFAALRASNIGVARPLPVLAIGFGMLCAYVGTLWVARSQAERQGLARLAALLEPGESITTRATMPDSTRPLSWTLLASTERRLLRQTIDLVRGASAPIVRPTLLSDPRVRAAVTSELGATWSEFARFPIATIEDDPKDARNVVIVLSDGRYFDQEWCQLRVVLPR